MFMQLAATLAAQPGWAAPPQGLRDATDAVLTLYRPAQLSEFLETFWEAGRLPAMQMALGVTSVADHQQMARPAPNLVDGMPAAAARVAAEQFPGTPPLNAVPPPPPLAAAAGSTWHHMVYAYMLENTRIVDIFRRVAWEWLHGERLPTASQATQRWLHTTEQLFFANTWPYSVRSVRRAT